jgi:hypothetical protein
MNWGTRELGNQERRAKSGERRAKSGDEPGNQGTKELGNWGTREPRNQGTKEPGNQGTKEPGNWGTRELGNQGTGEPGNWGTREPYHDIVSELRRYSGAHDFSREALQKSTIARAFRRRANRHTLPDPGFANNIITQHCAKRTQHSVLSTQYSALVLGSWWRSVVLLRLMKLCPVGS